MLNSVRTPSSRRIGLMWRIAGWWFGANIKPIPVCSMHCATCSEVRFRLPPSASIASAEPDLLDTLRLPCFATRPPAAAMTNKQVVEILNVDVPSPPVPTISSRCMSADICTLLEKSRITSAAATSSAMASPLERSAMRVAAAETGDALPLIICVTKSRMMGAGRSLPDKRVSMIWWVFIMFSTLD